MTERPRAICNETARQIREMYLNVLIPEYGKIPPDITEMTRQWIRRDRAFHIGGDFYQPSAFGKFKPKRSRQDA